MRLYDLRIRNWLHQPARMASRCGVATAILALCLYSPASATPNNGQGPNPPGGGGGGGGTTNPGGPGGGGFPCNPPPLPPGLVLPSYARGQIRETCGGVLRPIVNKPIKVILRVFQQPVSCDPNYIPPQHHYDVEMGTGMTDANGDFDVEFWTIDAGINGNEYLTELKVRIVVLDDTRTAPIWETAFYSQNANQEYFVYEDIIYCLTEGTRIRVLLPSGDSAYDAEVFVDGKLYPERTNPNGFVTITPPLQSGAKLVARAMVYESRSDRDGHSRGSTQNWKYRAYNTTIPLRYDANGDNAHFEPVAVTDPNGVYVLNLRRDACYIGLHWVESIEWDASPAELNAFRTKMQNASEFMFNATDGQMLIERVDLFDDMHHWDEADARVFADSGLRANVDWPADGFWRSDDLCCWRSSRMHMSRSNAGKVYVHEFGHYGMKLKDEYEDDGSKHCAHGVGGSIPDFAAGGDKASCIMFNQYSYSKICSNHVANRHVKGTRQGDEDCWSELKGYFMEESTGPNGVQLWRIQTPVDRGVIVGDIPGIPVSDWATLVDVEDSNNVQLCQNATFQWTSDRGLVPGAIIYSKNAGGRMIVQGVTNDQGFLKPWEGSDKTMAGVHVGDIIGATGTIYSGGHFNQYYRQRVYTEADCLSAMVVLQLAPGEAPPAPREELIEGEVQPFALAIQFEPGAAMGDAIVRVRAGHALDAAPAVRLSVGGESPVREPVMRLEDATGDWVGDVAGLPEQFNAIVEATAVDDEGERSVFATTVTFTGATNDEDSTLLTGDGRVELDIAAGALVEPTSITIGGSVAPLPDEFSGRIISGPIAVTSNGAELVMPATLRFNLPAETEDDLSAQMDPALLSVLAFDSTTGVWNEIVATFSHGKVAMVSQIDQFGTFLLLERGFRDDGTADGTNANDANADDSSVGNGESAANPSGTDTAQDDKPSDSVGQMDFGSGACGGGAALASPLMIGVIGFSRRRRRRGARRSKAAI